MYRRNGRYTDDIAADDIFGATLATLIIIAVVAVVASLFGWLIYASNQDADRNYNEAVAEFNTHSEAERAIIAPYFSYTLPEGETSFELKEVDETPYWTHVLHLLPYGIGLTVIILSAATFIAYWHEKSRRYRLADLPFRTIYGWLLFFAMFVGWPILLVSRIGMILKIVPERRREKRAVEEAAKKMLDQPAPSPELVGRRNQKAEAAYVAYVVRGRVKAHQDILKDLNARKASIEDKIRSYGQYLRDSQRQRGEIQAELAAAEKLEPEEATKERAKREWEAIRQMRGVSSVSTQKTRGKQPNALIIQVDVRVPYKNNLYDFGDYRISIMGDRYQCTRVRSGIRSDASSSAPDYNESGGFCFGSRRYEISEYVQKGRYLEAITLMIDSLHSVNDSYAEEMIPYCFRKVATIEQAKQRLQTT